MPRIHSIPGGIHPPQNKTQSLGQPIQSISLPEQLVIPLSQHIGAAAEPVVAVGEQVRKGQLIAKSAGFVSAPCHAPTSGLISAIGEHPVPHPSGLSAPCITLRPDGEERWIDTRGQHRYQQLDKAELLQIIRSAGIVGMGGAGFPTPVKLGSDKTIDTLIINGTECEPYITADDKLMQERAEDIVEGVRILSHLIAPGETLIGIEDNKPEALERMRQAAEGSDIEVVSFPTKYPSGGEKQLIQILTGKEVPRGGLPADIGIVLQNIGTAYAVFRAIRYDEPLISRVVTMTGDNIVHPGNYEVLIGTPIEHLLQVCGFHSDSERLIMGGPMMGFALTSTAVPVVKTTNCILAPSSAELPQQAHAQACIRCGMCAQACPASLLPQQLYWFAQGKEYDKLEQHNLFDCIECGCCSYVCPSNIPLVQYYRASKAEISKRRVETQKSEQAKTRFEARQQRLEAEQAQKEARRKARSNKKAPGKSRPAKPAPAAPPAANAPSPAAAPSPVEAAAATPAKQADTTASAAAGIATASTDSDKSDEVLAALSRVRKRKAQQDPAQAAIARAQAARANPLADTAADKVSKLEQRLSKAQAKLEQVKAADGDNLAAFQASVENLQQKLDAARAAAARTDDAATHADQQTARTEADTATTTVKPRPVATEPTPTPASVAPTAPPASDSAQPASAEPLPVADSSAPGDTDTAPARSSQASAGGRAEQQPAADAPTATTRVGTQTAETGPTPSPEQIKPVPVSNDQPARTATPSSTSSAATVEVSPGAGRKPETKSWSQRLADSASLAGAAQTPQLAEQVIERLQQKLQEVRGQYEQARREGGEQARELEAVARVVEQQMLDLVQRVVKRPAENNSSQSSAQEQRDSEQQPPADNAATSDAGEALVHKAIASADDVPARSHTTGSTLELNTLEQRLSAAREILAQATAENSPKREAFAHTVATLEQQVKQARNTD